MGLPPDLRCYDSVGSIARALGVRAPLDLLTNNPEKVEALRRALEPAQLEIRGTVPIQGPSSAFNRDYLRAKRAILFILFILSGNTQCSAYGEGN